MTKKIIGIGNAIVDILCRVDDNFLREHNLIKGSMSLINEKTAETLSKLHVAQITSGGSVANTIATLGQLTCNSQFIGKVGSDEFGKKFIEEFEKSGAKFIGENSYNKISAKSFILITPDAQRTMCTYLGCASQINTHDIEDQNFKDADYLYLEGYLWDDAETIEALQKAIQIAKKRDVKVAFSLSDSFCVTRHRQDFIDLVLNNLDILFANEREALELVSEQKFSTEKLHEFFSANPNLTAIVTRSATGCTIFDCGSILEVPTEKVTNLIDTTGAGDAFAAGVFYGLVNDFDLEKSARYGNLLASKIIQKFGARFEKKEVQNLSTT
ncbi:MAG: adenosine kinase [Alphaproteobacteria bacterium]|nr:adenosine kinase [Alphaproteobacteria bacterium]